MVEQTNPISGSRPGRPRYSWALAPMLRDALRRHYEQDFCAKQTQFGQVPFRGQVLCRQGVAVHRARGEPPQNKANFPKRGTEAVSLLRTADWGWSCIGSPACALLPLACVGWLYKQTQFRPLCRSGDRRSQGPIVQNKANFPRTAMGRDRQGVHAAGGAGCTNKPNLPAGAEIESLTLVGRPDTMRRPCRPRDGLRLEHDGYLRW